MKKGAKNKKNIHFLIAPMARVFLFFKNINHQKKHLSKVAVMATILSMSALTVTSYIYKVPTAQAAASFVACGAATSVASGNISSVAIPAGIATDDILITYVHTRDNVNSTMTGWTNKIEANHSNGTNRLEVFWKRTTGTESAPTVTHSGGNSGIARICAFRGVATSGDPFDTTGTVQENDATTISTASVTTSINGSLILHFFSTEKKISWGTYTGSATTEAAQNTNTLGSGNSNGLAYSIQSSAGATGVAGVTQSAKGKGLSVLAALKPAATKFTITDPVDTVINGNVLVTVKAEYADGTLDTTYQSDVTLVTSGSATGGGVVNIVNGIGTKSITDAVAETVNLTLSDTQSTGLDVSSTQNVVFSSTAVTPTKFIIIDPVDTVAGGSVSVTVRAEDNSGNLATTYQTDVTLITSGSATGGGVVDIVNGIGTKSITDAVAETVNLTLSDSQGTGLDVSSAQDVIFTATESGTTDSTPVTIEKKTIVRFYGRAFPGAVITLLSKTTEQEIPTEQLKITTTDNLFNLVVEGNFSGNYFYGIKIKDKDGRVTPVHFYNMDIALYSTNEKELFIPPTLGILKGIVVKDKDLTLFGYATPSSNIEVEIDGKILTKFAIADQQGFYKLLINTSDLSLGSHIIKVRQVDTHLHTKSDWSNHFSFTISTSEQVGTDLNNDGIINISDWSIFLFTWSKTGDERNQLDFNRDGKVDITDFSLFMTTFKKII